MCISSNYIRFDKYKTINLKQLYLLRKEGSEMHNPFTPVQNRPYHPTDSCAIFPRKHHSWHTPCASGNTSAEQPPYSHR